MTDTATEIITTWKGEMAFSAQSEFGETLQLGNLEGKPGYNPMRLLLMAVAGCTGMDIVSILKKKRVELNEMQIRVRGQRASDYPMIWTDIHITYLLWGNDLQPKDAEQAIQLSEEKYCSVGQMLGKAAKITSDYQILKPGEGAA